MATIIPLERIGERILLLRGQKVMLDRDLAALYGISTGRLNEQVRRNIRRFPSDFMFQLTDAEAKILISQFAISKRKGGNRKLPLVFTEQGIAMLSSVLHSERAILVNIAIMRAFVQLRSYLSNHKELARKLKDLEAKLESHDEQIASVFEAIRRLMTPDIPVNDRKIGFTLE